MSKKTTYTHLFRQSEPVLTACGTPRSRLRGQRHPPPPQPLSSGGTLTFRIPYRRRPVSWEHFPRVVGAQDEECFNLLERVSPSFPPSLSKAQKEGQEGSVWAGDPRVAGARRHDCSVFRELVKGWHSWISKGTWGEGAAPTLRGLEACKILQMLSCCIVGWEGHDQMCALWGRVCVGWGGGGR